MTHGLVVVLGGEALLLDSGHVQDVCVRQSLLDAVKLLLQSHRFSLQIEGSTAGLDV